MNIISDAKALSMCQNGPATTCFSQIPIIINDYLAYAFAAVPGNKPEECGKCYELSFTGEGKYETRLNHQKLWGKKLIVMVSNYGYDASNNQFDILIPGGGVGATMDVIIF